MKDTFYFSHDYNVRSDEKIKLLIRKHGMIGYGCFWAIIEDLYNNANAMRLDCEGIAFELRVDINIIESILKDYDLFVFNDENFGSLSIQKRLDERNKKSKSASKSANYRWGKYKQEMQTQCERIEILCERNAIKERKEKDIKETIYNFDTFWNDYDKKIGNMKKIISKWNKISEIEKQKIKDYIPKYKLSQPDKKYRKNIETFLNNKSWNDEIIGINKVNLIPALKIKSEENYTYSQLKDEYK